MATAWRTAWLLGLLVLAALPAAVRAELAEPAVLPSSSTKTDWREDPQTRRHPGSYLAVGGGYSLCSAWLESNADRPRDLQFSPINAWQALLRVGDAFAEWFALGFQINMARGKGPDNSTMGAFGLFLDTTFYPWKGLGIIPAVGLGFSYVVGKEENEFGYGFPLNLSLSLFYEFRLTRLLAVGPVIQGSWIAGPQFDSAVLFVGLEVIKWFDTATR